MKTKGELKNLAKSYLDKFDSFILSKFNSTYKVLGLGVLIGMLLSISFSTTFSIIFLIGVVASCLYLLAPNDAIDDGKDEYTDFSDTQDSSKDQDNN